MRRASSETIQTSLGTKGSQVRILSPRQLEVPEISKVSEASILRGKRP
jgi:hypothetical protein